jgi:uncharacterized membrane protein YhaH (DUF805 family)
VSAPWLAVRVLAPFRQLLDFGGRTSRRDHWPYMLLLIGLWLGGSFGYLAVTYPDHSFAAYAFAVVGFPPPVMMPLLDGLYLLLILLAFAAVVRRLHDSGYGAGWMLGYLLLEASYIGLVYYLNLHPIHGSSDPSTRLPGKAFAFLILVMDLPFFTRIWFVVVTALCLQRGTAGPNLYGPDPRSEVVS